MSKNLPANVGDMDLISGVGRLHMPCSNQAHVPQLLSLCSRVWNLQLLNLCTTITKACMPQLTNREQTKRNLDLSPTLHFRRHPCSTQVISEYFLSASAMLDAGDIKNKHSPHPPGTYRPAGASAIWLCSKYSKDLRGASGE